MVDITFVHNVPSSSSSFVRDSRMLKLMLFLGRSWYRKRRAPLQNELNVCYIISVVVVFNGVISVVGILAGPSSFNSHKYTYVL